MKVGRRGPSIIWARPNIMTRMVVTETDHHHDHNHYHNQTTANSSSMWIYTLPPLQCCGAAVQRCSGAEQSRSMACDVFPRMHEHTDQHGDGLTAMR